MQHFSGRHRRDQLGAPLDFDQVQPQELAKPCALHALPDLGGSGAESGFDGVGPSGLAGCRRQRPVRKHAAPGPGEVQSAQREHGESRNQVVPGAQFGRARGADQAVEHQVGGGADDRDHSAQGGGKRHGHEDHRRRKALTRGPAAQRRHQQGHHRRVIHERRYQAGPPDQREPRTKRARSGHQRLEPKPRFDRRGRDQQNPEHQQARIDRRRQPFLGAKLPKTSSTAAPPTNAHDARSRSSSDATTATYTPPTIHAFILQRYKIPIKLVGV